MNRRQLARLKRLAAEMSVLAAQMQLSTMRSLVECEKRSRDHELRGSECAYLLFDALVGAARKPGRLQRIERNVREAACLSSS